MTGELRSGTFAPTWDELPPPVTETDRVAFDQGE
jgi:hypothetical protein